MRFFTSSCWISIQTVLKCIRAHGVPTSSHPQVHTYKLCPTSSHLQVHMVLQKVHQQLKFLTYKFTNTSSQLRVLTCRFWPTSQVQVNHIVHCDPLNWRQHVFWRTPPMWLLFCSIVVVRWSALPHFLDYLQYLLLFSRSGLEMRLSCYPLFWSRYLIKKINK